MDRRTFIANSSMAAGIAVFSSRLTAAAWEQASAKPIAVPKSGRIRVAFLIGEGVNVIDTAGPWEVFQDTMPHHASGEHYMPFELYTVAPEKKTVVATGGLLLQPNHSIHDAPEPQVVVVPAHRSTPESLAWLRRVSEKNDVTMSVCTGAFQLARAGLLEGQAVTTHHDFWDRFAKEFPKLTLRRGLRFVDNGRIAAAGGLTSGIDLALHIVSRYFGRPTALRTAEYMEYTSEAWKQ